MPACKVCHAKIIVSKYGGKGQAHCPNLRNHPAQIKKRMKEFLKTHSIEELRAKLSKPSNIKLFEEVLYEMHEKGKEKN